MKQNHKGILISLLAMIVILSIKFHKVIGHLNENLFNNHVDAIKSYFNFSYLLRYGEGIKHHGINYPYGEHLHLVNSHPLYIYLTRLVDDFIPLADYGPAIMNAGMLLSMVITTPILFLILREYKLPLWYAIVFALLIQLGYPQFDRINGHFEMVIAFVIPGYWYLMIQYRKGRRQLYYAATLITFSTTCGLLSAYFVAFCSIFALAILIVDSWQARRHFKAFVQQGLKLLLIAIIPLLSLKLYIDLTDWAVDRPTNPWGFYLFNSNPLSIFLPDTSILKSILLPRMYDYAWEGRAYVGLVPTLIALSVTIFILYNLIKHRKLNLSSFSTDKGLDIYLLAASIVLLYAMCWPFKWGLHWLADTFTILKQFRALGRFSWVFYYVFTVYSANFIYHKLFIKARNLHSPFLGLLILIFIIGQWSLDAMINLNKSNNKKIKNNTFLLPDDNFYYNVFDQTTYTPSDFQAIVCIPFNQTNGDKMLFANGPWAWNMSMAFAYHTGIPLLQSFSPRISFPNSLSSIQLLADPCIKKTRLDDMNDKPLLVIASTEPLRPPEREFLNLSTQIYKDDNITLYHLDVQILKDRHKTCINAYRSLADSLGDQQRSFTTSPDGHFYYKDFEEKAYDSHRTFTGIGSFFFKKGEVIVFNEDLSAIGLTGKVEISFWLYFDKKYFNIPSVFFEAVDVNGKTVKSQYFYSRETHEVMSSWIRPSMIIDINPKFRYQMRISGLNIGIDDILIKPINSNILIRHENSDLFNNYRFERE